MNDLCVEIHCPDDIKPTINETLTDICEHGLIYELIMERLKKKADELRMNAGELELELSAFRKPLHYEIEALIEAQNEANEAEDALETFGRYAEVYNVYERPEPINSETWAKLRDIRAEMKYEWLEE